MVYIKRVKILHECQKCSTEFLGTASARFCINCRKARQKSQNKKWYDNNRSRHRELVRFWKSKNPEREKELRRNWARRKRVANPAYAKMLDIKVRKYYKDNCKTILKQKQKYHIKNRNRININSKQWRKLYPEKTAANNMKLRTRDPIDPELIKLIFKLYDYECMYCCSKKQLSLEHILPVSRGGDNSFENLGVACKSCNSSKGHKTIVEFKDWLAMI